MSVDSDSVYAKRLQNSKARPFPDPKGPKDPVIRVLYIYIYVYIYIYIYIYVYLYIGIVYTIYDYIHVVFGK